MSRVVEIGAVRTGIPGSYLEKLTVVQSGQLSDLSNGIVAVVGECEGVLQPGVVHVFRSDAALKELLGDGPAYHSMRAIFNPVPEAEDIRGASRVLFVRPNPATQGEKTVVNSSSQAVLEGLSIAYGKQASLLSREITTATKGGFGVKAIVGEIGQSDEVGDDLGFEPTAVIRYKGSGIVATMTITPEKLSTVVDASADLDLPFSTYKTLADLAAVINKNSDYEMVLVTPKATSFLCSKLDYVSAVSIKSKSGSLTLTNAETDTFTGSVSGLANEEVLKIGNEYLFVKDAATKKAIRGFLDSPASSHSSVTADTFVGLSATNQAVIDWSQRSQRLRFTRASGGNVGRPSTSLNPEAMLTGAGEGTTTSDYWANALKALERLYYRTIHVATSDAAVHKQLSTHLSEKWGKLFQPATAHVGASSNESKSEIKTRLKNLPSKNISLWYQHVGWFDENGLPGDYDPVLHAAVVCGIQAGTEAGEPLNDKILPFTHISAGFEQDTDTFEEMIEVGASQSSYDGRNYSIMRALTTWVADDELANIDPAVRSAISWTIYYVARQVWQKHGGKKAIATPKSVEGTVIAALEDCRDKYFTIVEGSKRVGNQRQVIPAFRDVKAESSGNKVPYGFRFTPVNGNDFFAQSATVDTYQATT